MGKWENQQRLNPEKRGIQTSVLTSSQQVNDVGVMTQFTQNLQLTGKVSVIIFRSVF